MKIEYSNHMYFIELDEDSIYYNKYPYFRFESRDEWFRTDLARRLIGFEYYNQLKEILDKKLNMYIRKEKLKKLEKCLMKIKMVNG